MGHVGFLASASATPGPARKLRGAISEHFRSGAGTSQGGEDGFQRLRVQNARGLFTNRDIGIRGKNAERFDAVFRLERAASPQMASFRSGVARPERISSCSAPLISASRDCLQSISRERDLALVARGTEGSQCFSIQLQMHRARIFGGHLKMIRGPERMSFAGHDDFIEDHVAVGHNGQLRFAAGLDLQLKRLRCTPESYLGQSRQLFGADRIAPGPAQAIARDSIKRSCRLLRLRRPLCGAPRQEALRAKPTCSQKRNDKDGGDDPC